MCLLTLRGFFFSTNTFFVSYLNLLYRHKSVNSFSDKTISSLTICFVYTKWRLLFSTSSFVIKHCCFKQNILCFFLYICIKKLIFPRLFIYSESCSFSFTNSLSFTLDCFFFFYCKTFIHLHWSDFSFFLKRKRFLHHFSLLLSTNTFVFCFIFSKTLSLSSLENVVF